MALINTTTTGVLGTTVYGDGAGALTVQKDGVTQGIYGNIPAFSAYHTTIQSVSSATTTKITYDSEAFDTNNNFASSRFTPTVAGYYQISAGLFLPGSSTGGAILYLYKNGTEYAQFSRLNMSISLNIMGSGSILLYLNGSTDYVEVYANQNSGSTLNMGNGAQTGCWFTGFLAKAA